MTKEIRCEVQLGATRFVCDREQGHDGEHRTYFDTVDEVIFWPQDGRNWFDARVSQESETVKRKVEVARTATGVLRDFARQHGMHFRERDELVVAIHDALDAVEGVRQ
jgi:hypothetical protein